MMKKSPALQRLFSLRSSDRSARRAGFSLVELLVVIAIIGILIAAGIVAFSSMQRNSRDSRRQTDIRAMQQGFEQYYNQNDSLYASTCAGMATNFPGGTLPQDPRSGAYSCTTTGVIGLTATGYCACARLEQNGKGNAIDQNCSFGTGANANYYCLMERQ